MTWTEVSPPADVAGLNVTGACAVGEDDVLFAASQDASVPQPVPRIVQWAADNWTTELVMDASEWSTDLLRWPRAYISGMTSDDSWAALGHQIFHRTGAGWSRVDGWESLPEVQALTSSFPVGPIEAGADGDLWAMVGSYVLLHFTHGAWQAFPVTPPTGYYYDFFSELWVTHGGDVWLGAGRLVAGGGGIVNAAVLLHFDGKSWNSVDAGFFSVFFLWGDGAGGLWFGVSGPETLPLRHYDPSSGTITPYPQIGDWTFPGGITTIWGMSRDDEWVAGDNLASWNGTAWTVDTSLPSDMRARLRLPVMTGDRKSLWLVSTGGPVFFRGTSKPASN